MRFNLKGPHKCSHTEIVFYRDENGVVHPFPSDNAELVRREGTDEAKRRLDVILKG